MRKGFEMVAKAQIITSRGRICSQQPRATRNLSTGANNLAASRRVLIAILIFGSVQLHYHQAKCQLPEDMQRELNQNLAEQARIQAMRARHQQQMQARTGGGGGAAQAGGLQQKAVPAPGAQKQPFDPNNYSFQQVSPPIQYSFYQPFGDAAQPQQQRAGNAQQQPPINIDLNNLNFDLPTPQAQVSTQQLQGQQQPQLVPSFTGVGGLPIMQPPAAASSRDGHGQQQQEAAIPFGQAPLAPQAQQARGPPLTEADFRDITGGENYGAPGGPDFGLGNAAGGAQPRQQQDNTDAQLREFGMPDEQQQQAADKPSRRQDLSAFDLGALDNPMGGGAGSRRSPPTSAFEGDGDFFGGAMQAAPRAQQQKPNDFDFASQPSSDQAAAQSGAGGGSGAPGSLQALLGGEFPGLGGGRDSGTMGLESLARGAGDRAAGEGSQRQRVDDGALDLADLGGASGTDSRADGFPAVGDIGGLGGLGEKQQQQPDQSGDGQEFGLAAAAAAPQPKSVPYPDGAPQLVGTLWALGQPQSLSQTRYNALPDKGTYQDYPAYQSGGNDFGAVAGVVDSTPRARSPGPGRYAQPSHSELAAEWRDLGQAYDYAKSPLSYTRNEDGQSSSLGGDIENNDL